MTRRTVIHSARIVSDGAETPGGWLVLDGTAIAARGEGCGWRAQIGPEDVVIDASGLTAVPGFIDLHCHGGGGVSVEDIADEPRLLPRMTDVHRKGGTTRSLLSLVSAELPALARRLAALGALVATDPRLLGVHLEGPFLAETHRGAHPSDLLRTPTTDAVARLCEAGPVAMLTIAPELPGADVAIRALVDGGVVVAVGHTAADHMVAHDAFARGASVLTHAFNGMRGIHHRAPGPVVAALEAPHVVLELIVDGVHVHPSVVAAAVRAAPGRVAFVSDAMAAAGAPDGAYRLGDLDVAVRHGVATHGDDGALAGSTLTLDRALANAVTAGIPLADAVDALTAVPARVLGVEGRLGRLAAGYAADVVLLAPDLSVVGVWADGVLVHGGAALCERERNRVLTGSRP